MKENLNRMLEASNKWLLLLVISCISISAFAQESIITGNVISQEDGLAIPGVSVVIKGTTNGTITDIDGNYSIKAKMGDVLLFSFVGMKNFEQTVNSAKVNVKLEPESIGLDEVVAIGYGTQKKKEISGAVVQVKSEELTRISTADLGTALQGQVAGVNVTASSGAPGEGSNIQIRGLSSVNGNNSPLFVVDGIPQDGDPRLSNNEIETLDILKDAASAAIYGTRGSGGVILITTKRGKAGQMRVSVDSYGGIQKITSGIPLMDFEEYWYTQYAFASNNNGTHADNTWTPLEMNKNDFTNNSSILDVVQNDNAVIQNHSVNISGGKDDLKYSLVASYFQQDGVLINSGYERINVRSNTNYTKGRWDITMGLGMRVEEREREPWNLLYDAYKYKPHQAPLDPNQTVGSAGGDGQNNDANQLATMMYKFQQSDIENTDEFNGNINVRFNILKGFNYTLRAGARFSNGNRNTINPDIVVFNEDGEKVENSNTRSGIKNESKRSTSYTLENALDYTKKFGDHKLKLLGVVSTEKYTYVSFNASKKDIFSNEVTVINGAVSEPNAASGKGTWNQDRVNTLVGMLGRVQYDYKGRYLLSASVRRDGSSRFVKDNRWGMFPSASVAWNIADEAFWAPLSEIANSFKLRGSIGTTGNQNFADYSYYPTVSVGHDYPFGPDGKGELVNGAIQESFANSQVRWETTVQSNIGIDVGFFSNRLSFTADFYNSDKKDMLFPLLLPSSVGGGKDAEVILNVGNMNNRGVEFAAGWRQAGKVSWGVNGTFTKNINKITKMSGSTEISYFKEGYAINVSGNNDKITALKEGYEAGSFFVMETNGIINTEEKLGEYQKIVPSAKMGDLIYVDTNGDGSIDDNDRVYGGSGMPDFELGLNANVAYKGFDLSMALYASIGNEIINGSKMFAYDSGTHKDLLYQWSDSNPYGVIPSHRGGGHLNKRGWADVWVEDGSFLRLRNVTLGYTLPKTTLSSIGISKFRVYLATDNPLTLTKYQGYDPEVGGNGLATRGIDRGSFPISSQYRVGLQLDF
ncbi:SusC/RagA family TonB-linked outer membrane protein [Saccharicrinis aurantiacus]|uniref:SusC/RagA family TonB-linked outer membrane protein n=1 Tax=Saccharicrinis aurantiacus TaxID=1849719 RepID=UPI0008384F7F|nr:TonB-dependent receptor [Saccharicrinis aurantiacus]